jgi:hypothetical protein
MASNRKPPGGRSGNDDTYDPWGQAKLFAMTMRHGSDYTKRYLNSLARVRETHEEDGAHA